MEADGVSLALPLVAAPELVKLDDPALHLSFAVFGVMAEGESHGRFRPFFITNRGSLDGVEHVVRH